MTSTSTDDPRVPFLGEMTARRTGSSATGTPRIGSSRCSTKARPRLHLRYRSLPLRHFRSPLCRFFGDPTARHRAHLCGQVHRRGRRCHDDVDASRCAGQEARPSSHAMPCETSATMARADSAIPRSKQMHQAGRHGCALGARTRGATGVARHRAHSPVERRECAVTVVPVTGSAPPASRTSSMDLGVVAILETRRGRISPWHQQTVRTSCTVRICRCAAAASRACRSRTVAPGDSASAGRHRA